MDTLLKDSAFMAKFEQSKLDTHARAQEEVKVLIDGIYNQVFNDLVKFISLPPPSAGTQQIKDEADCHLLTEIETVSPPTTQPTLFSTPPPIATPQMQFEPQPRLLIDHENFTSPQPTQTMTPSTSLANLQPILKPITIASSEPNNPTPITKTLREQVPSVPKRRNLTPITLKLRNKSRKIQLGSTSTIASGPKTQKPNTLSSSDWWLPEVIANPNEQNFIQNQNATISHNLSSTQSSSTGEPSIPITESIQNTEATTPTPTVYNKPTENQITLADVAAIKIKEEPKDDNNHNTIITRNMRNKRAVVNGPDEDNCDCPECLNDQIKIKKEINESQMEIVDDNMDDANGAVIDAEKSTDNDAQRNGAHNSAITSGHVSANSGASTSANASTITSGHVSANSGASTSANSGASPSAQASASPSVHASASTSRHVSANSGASPSAQASANSGASTSANASTITSGHVSANSGVSPSAQASANSGASTSANSSACSSAQVSVNSSASPSAQVGANTNTRHYNPLITLESGSSASANSCVFTRVHLGPPSTSSQPGIFKIVKTVARASSSANSGGTKVSSNLGAINQWSIINATQPGTSISDQTAEQNGTVPIQPTCQSSQKATDKPTIITKFIVTFPNSPAQDGNSTSSMPKPSLSSSNTPTDITTKANSIINESKTKCPEIAKSPKQPQTPKPTIQCPKCNKKFLKTDTLLTHIDSCIHNIDRKYICELCQQEFGRKQYLTEHMKVHTKEKPFSCRTCSKVFKREGNLLTHQQTVHQKIRPYRCNWQDCRFGAFSRANLRRHIGSKHFNVPRDKQLRGETPDNYDPDKYIRKVTNIGQKKRRNKSKSSAKN